MFMENMKANGIQTSIHYPPIHLFSDYRDGFTLQKLTNTEMFAAREVTLPLYPTLSDDSVRLVVEAVQRSLAQIKQISV